MAGTPFRKRAISLERESARDGESKRERERKKEIGAGGRAGRGHEVAGAVLAEAASSQAAAI